MSDPKYSYGDPVDEPKDAVHDADVVGRAHEGLAEAEAARNDVPAEPVAPRAAESDAPRDADPVAPRDAQPVASADAEPETVVVEEKTVVAERVDTSDDEDARWAMYAASADAPDTRADETPTVAAAPVVTPSEPVAPEAPARESYAVAPSAFPGAQPIFVQAPEAPTPRGNRGAAGAIGLLAALAFAVLYLAATLGLGLVSGEIEVSGLADAALAAVGTWALWVPVVVFYIAFWFLGALINRGSWGHWVVWGLLVGAAAYGGHLLGQLFQAPFWMLTARQGAQLVETQLLAPLAIVAFVLGRELTIWFGAWVAARGRRVTELNNEAQREYERTLEAGPQLHRG